jgi:hypothetical protein
MGGGRGESRVRPRRQAGVHSGVVGSDAVAAVADGRERRRGVRWSMGSKGSNCAKGVSSGSWAAAWEGVGFGPGGRGGILFRWCTGAVKYGVVSRTLSRGKGQLSRGKAKTHLKEGSAKFTHTFSLFLALCHTLGKLHTLSPT